MHRRIKLRTLKKEEVAEINRLANSRTESYRLVQRARVIAALLQNPKISASQAAIEAGFRSPAMGVTWIKRFNEEGIEGLYDKPRYGRSRTHSEEVRQALIEMAGQNPIKFGYFCKYWTLEQLQQAFKKQNGIHLSGSTIWTWMEEGGFKWSHQQGWIRGKKKDVS